MNQQPVEVTLVGFFTDWTKYRDENQERLKNLPQHYTQYDIHMAWEVKSAGPDTVITGVVKNVRYAWVEGLEVWAARLDASGRPGASAACFIVPHQLRQDQLAAFDLRLPGLTRPGTQLRLSYKYQNTEDGGGNRQSFDVEVTGT